jgi:hypothetical protein
VCDEKKNGLILFLNSTLLDEKFDGGVTLEDFEKPLKIPKFGLPLFKRYLN